VLAMKKLTWAFYEVGPFFGQFFSFSHYNEISLNILSFLHCLDGLHVNVTATPWNFNLVLF